MLKATLAEKRRSARTRDRKRDKHSYQLSKHLKSLPVLKIVCKPLRKKKHKLSTKMETKQRYNRDILTKQRKGRAMYYIIYFYFLNLYIYLFTISLRVGYDVT